MSNILNFTSNGVSISSDTSQLIDIRQNGTSVITTDANNNINATNSKVYSKNIGSNFPIFSVTKNAEQTVTAGAFTKITFDTIEFDTHNYYNLSTNIFQPKIAGEYQVNWGVFFIASTTTNFLSTVYKTPTGSTSSEYARGMQYASNAFGSTGSVLIYMDGISDYLEIYVYQSNAQTTNPGLCYFQGCYIRG